jgi:hypothetical protein
MSQRDVTPLTHSDPTFPAPAAADNAPFSGLLAEKPENRKKGALTIANDNGGGGVFL